LFFNAALRGKEVAAIQVVDSGFAGIFSQPIPFLLKEHVSAQDS